MQKIISMMIGITRSLTVPLFLESSFLFGSHTVLNNLQFGIAHLIEFPAIGSFVPFLQSRIILTHRLEVEAQYHDAKHKEDGKECVEIKRYRLAEKCQSVLTS